MSGARGPTGPSGQARSSPAKGGVAGSVSRSSPGNKSGVGGGGGGGGGGAMGNRGSSVGAKVGANSGSQPKGAGNKSGVGGGGGGGGGRFGARGSSVGAPVGKKSGAQAPAARPSRPLGGANPMASQGVSFKSPQAAQKANTAITKKGFGTRMRKNAEMSKIAARADIEDRRKMMGPFDARNPKYVDDGKKFNPNDPLTGKKLVKRMRDGYDDFEGQMREGVVYGRTKRETMTPQEIRERTRQTIARSDKRIGEVVNSAYAQRKGAMTPIRDPGSTFKKSVSLPNVPVGMGRAMGVMGKYAHGGVVKKKKK